MIQFVFIFMLAASPLLFAGPIENLQPNSWLEVSNSHMNALDPCPAHNCAYSFVEGISAVMDDWAGAAFDTDSNRLVVTGGGHSGYAGNELYAFDMNLLKWLRLTDPSPIGNEATTCTEPPDGTAGSRHNYNGLAYISHVQRFFEYGGDIAYMAGGCSNRNTWTFHFSTLKWELRAPTGQAPDGNKQNNCAYDPFSKKVYYHSSAVGNYSESGWSSYDYDQNKWTRLNSELGAEGMTSAIDTKRKLIVEVGANGWGSLVKVYDLNTAVLTRTTWTTTGDNSIVSRANMGLAYDPVSDKIVAWAGGTDVFTLDLDTKVWTKHVGAGATPTGANSNGTYGRFRYCPNKNVFVAVNHVNENVFIYRLTAGAGTGIEKNDESGLMNNEIGLRVTPNPVRSAAILRIAGAGIATDFNIYDLSGKRMAHLSTPVGGQAVWNTEKVPAGVYVIQGITHSGILSKRFLVQH